MGEKVSRKKVLLTICDERGAFRLRKDTKGCASTTSQVIQVLKYEKS